MFVCKDLQVKFIRQDLHFIKTVCFFKKFHLNKNAFIELFHFQELSIYVGIMVNSLSVNVIWNHVANCL